jgi:uncharacterized protein
LVKLFLKGLKIFSSEAIFLEYKKVLIRDFEYTKEEADFISNKILPLFEIVIPTEKINCIKDDSDDNIVLECAVATNANFIISYDKHLLTLEEFRGIKVMKPSKFL